MRRVIAVVIIGLVMAIAFTVLQQKETPAKQTEGPQPVNYFQQLHECGAVCVPLAIILVAVAE